MALKTRYWLVSISYTNMDGSQQIGSEGVFSEGMLNANKAANAIMKEKKCMNVSIFGLFEFKSKEDFDAFFAMDKTTGFSAN